MPRTVTRRCSACGKVGVQQLVREYEGGGTYRCPHCGALHVLTEKDTR